MIWSLALVAVAAAQATNPAPASVQSETLDPARLTAAAKLIDTVMPPARREAMITGMMAAMTENVRQSLGPSAGQALDDPRVRAILNRFIAEQQADSAANMRAALPRMTAAMQRAYARRFTVAQMAEIQAFFATPTGQLYMDQGSTIMSDPDVAAWQRDTMASQWPKMRERVRAMQIEILALDPPVKSDD